MSFFSISMDESQIILELKKRKNPDRVGGDIHLAFNSNCFPSGRCYDYPVTILTWWLENCVKLSLGTEDSVENYFMDGPYEFWAQKKYNMVEFKFFLRESGVEDDDDEIYIEAFPSFEIFFEEYKNELCKAGNIMLKIFNENHVTGETVDHLKSLIRDLTDGN
jgi:hypothetical protein